MKKKNAGSNLSFNADCVQTPKSRLRAIVSDRSLLLGDRFDALLLLSSWGQCHEYAHYRLLDQPPSVPAPGRVRKWQTRPMNRADFARELRVSPTAIGDLVRRRLKEGLMVQHPKSSRLLVPATLIEKAAGA